eukprot:scaffold340919_cov15-Prasinocladus_malaysianus.AAC.1
MLSLSNFGISRAEVVISFQFAIFGIHVNRFQDQASRLGVQAALTPSSCDGSGGKAAVHKQWQLTERLELLVCALWMDKVTRLAGMELADRWMSEWMEGRTAE